MYQKYKDGVKYPNLFILATIILVHVDQAEPHVSHSLFDTYLYHYKIGDFTVSGEDHEKYSPIVPKIWHMRPLQMIVNPSNIAVFFFILNLSPYVLFYLM